MAGNPPTMARKKAATARGCEKVADVQCVRISVSARRPGSRRRSDAGGTVAACVDS